MPLTVIGYKLECCYNSSPKLPGVYAHTVVKTTPVQYREHSTQSLSTSYKNKINEVGRMIVREGRKRPYSPLFSFSQILTLLLVVNKSI
jgi:hypothetical protein